MTRSVCAGPSKASSRSADAAVSALNNNEAGRSIVRPASLFTLVLFATDEVNIASNVGQLDRIASPRLFVVDFTSHHRDE